MLGVGLVFIFPVLYIAIEYVRQNSCRAVFTLDNLFEFYVYLKQLLIGELIVAGTTELGLLLTTIKKSYIMKYFFQQKL